MPDCRGRHYGRGFCRPHYNALPEVQALARARMATPRNRGRRAAREATAESRAKHRIRSALPQARAAWLAWSRTPHGRAVLSLRNQMRRARERAAQGSLTPSEWLAVIAGWAGRCAYCGMALEEVTQDHIVALARGGRHDPLNVVPACKPCNSSKGASDVWTWIADRGLSWADFIGRLAKAQAALVTS